MSYEIFPPSHTGGGVRLPYIPTKEEMENCGYAKNRKSICPRKRGERNIVAGGYSPLIDCCSCPYHPMNIPMRGVQK